MTELLQSIRRNAIGLGLFALVTAGAIAVAQVGTAERIQRNILQAQSRALNEIVTPDQYDNDLLTDSQLLSDGFDTRLLGPLKASDKLYRARRNGEVTTVLLPAVAPDGYTMEIRLLVGIHADGSVAGVRVTEHRETPGLGDKIDARKSPWILAFTGTSLTQPPEDGWAVKKDGGVFDQFTGATITPRAVVRAVSNAQRFFQQHRAELLQQPASAGAH